MQTLRHSSKTRLIAYGLFVVAFLVCVVSVGGFIFRKSSTQASLSTSSDGLGEDLVPSALPEDDFDPLEPTPAPTELAATSENPVLVVVYIAGAVVKPDTYEVPADARIADVVRLAGGLTEEADLDQLNLAAHVHDAERIYIVRRGETSTASTNNQQGSDTTGGLINLNTASVSELESLDGIGKVLAQRIVDWRSTNGPFASTEDLRQVKGVTTGIYDQIKDNITVS